MNLVQLVGHKFGATRMELLDLFSIKCRNFKPYGEELAGFDSIKPFNIIIGRNNTGKSSLLDLIEYLKNQKHVFSMGHKGAFPKVHLLLDFTPKVYKFLHENEQVPEINSRSAAFLKDFNGRLDWTFEQNGSYTLHVDDKHSEAFSLIEQAQQLVAVHGPVLKVVDDDTIPSS